MSIYPGVKRYPTLFGLDSAGRVKVWNLSVEHGSQVPAENTPAYIVTEHGLKGGKQQEARVRVEMGKNVGRTNETTPWKQADREGEAKWEKQIDKGYVPDECLLAAVAEKPRAMLAQPFKKAGHRIVWPAAVQPKLDGIRLLAHVQSAGVLFYSRNGKPINTVDHLVSPLMRAFQAGTVVDGELFNPEMTLQDIVSGKSRQSAKSTRLQYWIYDLIEDAPFSERYETIERAFEPC